MPDRQVIASIVQNVSCEI